MSKNAYSIVEGGLKRKWTPCEGQENQPVNNLTTNDAASLAKRQKPALGLSPSQVVVRPVALNKEQNAVLQAVMRGQSVFFTGSAGTGKSFLMKRIIGKGGPPRWPSGKTSASRAEGPGFNPACAGIFFRSSHTSDFKIGTPVATLPGAWRYRVSTWTGQPGVSIL